MTRGLQLLLLCWSTPALAHDSAALRQILGLDADRPVTVIGRGALVVVDLGDESHHDIHIVDVKRQRATEVEDADYFGTRKATVNRFLGAPDLVEVTLFVTAPRYRRQRHIVVRTSGEELAVVCEVEGDSLLPPDPATAVSFRRAAGAIFTFDVDTKSAGAAKRQRYTVEPDGMCGSPVDVATLSGPAETSVTAVLAKERYRDAHILKTLPSQLYVAEAVTGGENDLHTRLLLVAPHAKKTLVVLGEAGLDNASAVTVSMAPFLLRKDLTDLQIGSSYSNGMRSNASSAHYLLRRVPSAPELACEFEGESAGGVEDVNHSTTVKIEKRSDDPFSFAVIRRHRGGRIGDSEARTETTVCTVPPTGGCQCER